MPKIIANDAASERLCAPNPQNHVNNSKEVRLNERFILSSKPVWVSRLCDMVSISSEVIRKIEIIDRMQTRYLLKNISILALVF